MDIISSKIVKTRKEHYCVGCLETFPIGTYLTNVIFKINEIASCYWCKECNDYIKKHRLNELYDDDGYPGGCVRDDKLEKGME